ncbi:MAG TPA: acetyl-CoA carboxylase, biotin carboxyl carrier protein, partial [Hyphomonas sp.]|nr:acetyl-CoA carboxylase, biotin carboxyl carrier protein [Hyphomonas sp.]HCJ17022.1 acetyl-CoA carboxylase, biotin carboxyl carrier protein [Hyphomonas sp.]
MSTTKNKLDTGLVRELAAILREADLGEVEVEHEGLRIRVSKP